jgi:hypothetical protein
MYRRDRETRREIEKTRGWCMGDDRIKIKWPFPMDHHVTYFMSKDTLFRSFWLGATFNLSTSKGLPPRSRWDRRESHTRFRERFGGLSGWSWRRQKREAKRRLLLWRWQPPHNAESKANFNFEAKGSVLVQNYVIYPLKTLSFNLGHSKINSSAITS